MDLLAFILFVIFLKFLSDDYPRFWRWVIVPSFCIFASFMLLGLLVTGIDAIWGLVDAMIHRINADGDLP